MKYPRQCTPEQARRAERMVAHAIYARRISPTMSDLILELDAQGYNATATRNAIRRLRRAGLIGVHHVAGARYHLSQPIGCWA